MTDVEFFFDFSSPFAYLASTQVREVAARAGADVVLRPFLLGALFKEVGAPNVPLFAMPEPKRRYMIVDLYRWADDYGVPFSFPSRFPIHSVKALRMVCACAATERWSLVDGIYRAYWVEDRDISDLEELRRISRERIAGADALVDRIGDPEVKLALRRATDQAVSLGICGAPSFIVDGQVFWGQDRLCLVRDALDRANE
jgi:2-hydroxychromene-2-carboxylate isomerase